MNNKSIDYLFDEAIIKTILNYLDESIYDYAVLIDGSWGVGKTYFIKEKLIPCIDNREETKGNENSEYKKRKPIYISLYGIRSTSEISGQLYTNILTKSDILTKSEKRTKVVSKIATSCKLVNDVATLFGKGLEIRSENVESIISTFSDLKNYILIFDDLERCDCDINEVLGYINTFVEHEKVKVILVANEAEINKHNINKNMELKYLIANKSNIKLEETDKNSNNDINFLVGQLDNSNKDTGFTLGQLNNRVKSIFKTDMMYNEIKEKLIGITIKYEPNLLETLKYIIETKFDIEDIKPYLFENLKAYLRFMNKYNHKNLRSFQFFLSKVSKIFKDIDVFGYEYKDYIINSILNSCFYTSIMYKDGGYEDIWNEDKNQEYKYNTKIPYPDVFLTFKFVDDFIINNILDSYSAKSILDKFHNEYVEENNNPDSPLNKLKNGWWILSEEEVVNLISEVINTLKNDKYSKQLYGSILISLCEIKTTGIDIDLNNVTEVMISNINKTDKYEWLDKSYMPSELIDITEFEKYFNRIIESMEKKKSFTNNLEIERHLNSNKWSSNLHDYILNKKDISFNEGFLCQFDNQLLYDKLSTASSKEIQTFRKIINIIYERNSNKIAMNKDLSEIESLLAFINNGNDNYDKIQLNQIKWLKKQLNEIISTNN